METQAAIKKQKLDFSGLEKLASFIREKHLKDFIQEQHEAACEIEMPLLQQIAHLSEEERLAFAEVTAREFLESLEQGRAIAGVRENIEKWLNRQINFFEPEKISFADLPMITYIRRRAFRRCIALYTEDMETAMMLLGELEDFLMQYEILTSNAVAEVLQKKLEEQNRFADLMTRTSPGIVYVYDLSSRSLLYVNDQTTTLLGYQPEKLMEMREAVIPELLHPDDADEMLSEQLAHYREKPRELRKREYRMKHADGTYKWFRVYEAAFRKNSTGEATETIGIALDIHKEKIIEQELSRRKTQLLEAERIAGLGSFEWNFVNRADSYYSPKLVEMFELELPARDGFFAKVHADDRARLLEDIDKAVKETGVFECEYRYLRSNGEVIYSSRGVLQYEKGTPVSMTGTVIDVTDRYRTIERLKENKELYKQAQAMAKIGNWSLNLHSRELQWSDEMFRIHGLQPASQVMKYPDVLSFIHPEDREMTEKDVDALVRNHIPYENFHRVLLGDGSIKTIHARGNIVRDHNGQAVKAIGTCQDVTRQKEIERELLEKRNFIEKIADATPSIIASYNTRTGKYIFINQSLKKLLGYEPEVIFQEGIAFFQRILHPDDQPVIDEQNRKALEMANSIPGGEPEPVLEFKYRVKAKDGTYRWLHTYGTVFDRDEQGKVLHVLNISVDITELMEAEDILSRKNTELRQSNANLEEFAYIASHDLKEPLRKISSFGDRLMHTQNEKLDDQGKMYLGKIVDSSQRMQTMITDLLSVSLISGNKNFEKCSLRAILDEVLKTLEYKIEKKGAVIEVDELPEAQIVPSQFRQLFQNLISNSLKFSKEETTPRISITHRFLSQAEITEKKLLKNSPYLQVSVTDNGIGFDNQYAEKIFTIFHRLHGRSEYEGTGIGLAICRKIIAHHQGMIFAEGKENEGAAFTFIIPLTQPLV